MSSFTSRLVVRPLPDGRKWELIESFSYHLGHKDSDTYIIVPVGFVTDFASIPRIFWMFLPPWGKYGKASVIHDYLMLGNPIVSKGVELRVTHQKAHQIFYEAMTVLGVNIIVRKVMYASVSLFTNIRSWFTRK